MDAAEVGPIAKALGGPLGRSTGQPDDGTSTIGLPLVDAVAPPVARPDASLPDSFTAAFAALYSRAYHAAYRLLGNRQEAEDVAQEACARACIRWKRVSRVGDATPWVVRVATNLAIDQWRRNRRAAAREHDPAVPAPLDAVDGRRVDLHRALAELPRRQRDVVVLRYVVDLSEADTAAALGCARGTVKAHAARGLSALRAALGSDEQEEDL